MDSCVLMACSLQSGTLFILMHVTLLWSHIISWTWPCGGILLVHTCSSLMDFNTPGLFLAFYLSQFTWYEVRVNGFLISWVLLLSANDEAVQFWGPSENTGLAGVCKLKLPHERKQPKLWTLSYLFVLNRMNYTGGTFLKRVLSSLGKVKDKFKGGEQ